MNLRNRKPRGESASLTKAQRREISMRLKQQALDGDLSAVIALSNFELSEAIREQTKRFHYTPIQAAA